jgi:hypothetical protein
MRSNSLVSINKAEICTGSNYTFAPLKITIDYVIRNILYSFLWSGKPKTKSKGKLLLASMRRDDLKCHI